MKAKLNLDKKKEQFCSRAHHERVIRPISGRVSPCCKLDGFLIEQKERLDGLIEDLDNEVRRSECRICWRSESQNVRSHRQLGNEIWKGKKSQHLEIYYSNICDLACVYCNQLYSSKWQAELLNTPYEIPEYLKNPNFTPLKPTAEHQDFILDEVKRLAHDSFDDYEASATLLGGEPLMHTLNKTTLLQNILETFFANAKEHASFRLAIQTNGNTPAELLNKTIQYLTECQKRYAGLFISVGFSFESTEENYNYVRYGGNWETFVQNMSAWSYLTNFEMTVQTSINNVALKELPKFIEFTNEFSKNRKPLTVRINPVTYPRGLSISVLDKSFEVYFHDAIQYLRTNQVFLRNYEDVLRDIIELEPMLGTNQSNSSLTEALNLFQFFERSRKLKIQDINPELYSYLINAIQKNMQNTTQQSDLHNYIWTH